MGYQVMIIKFENGDPGVIPFDEFSATLKNYGEIVETDNGLEFISNIILY